MCLSPPSGLKSDIELFCDNLHSSLVNIISQSSSLMVTGDFNAHCSNWCFTDISDTVGLLLNNIFQSFSLHQIVNFPTHLNSTGLGACLDLVATNLAYYVTRVAPDDTLGDSDHLSVSTFLSLPGRRSNPVFQQVHNNQSGTSSTHPNRHDFCRVSTDQWAALNHDLDHIRWSSVLSPTDVDLARLSSSQAHCNRPSIDTLVLLLCPTAEQLRITIASG